MGMSDGSVSQKEAEHAALAVRAADAEGLIHVGEICQSNLAFSRDTGKETRQSESDSTKRRVADHDRQRKRASGGRPCGPAPRSRAPRWHTPQ